MNSTSQPRRAVATIAVGVLLLTGGAVASPAYAAPGEGDVQALAGEPPETFEVSQSAQAASSSIDPFMTADAQRVVFSSSASDLVAGDTNDQPDIFLTEAIQGSADPFSGTPTLVSAPDGAIGATRANGPSSEPVSSMDGRFVAFVSSATNLVGLPSTGDGRDYIYVRDTRLNVTLRIQGTPEPDGDSWAPDLSDDGRILVFTSAATNLASGDVNGKPDVFTVDLDPDQDGELGDYSLEKLYPAAQFTEGTHDGVVSGNGYIVAFVSSTDLATGLPGVPDTLSWTNLAYNRSGTVTSKVIGKPSIDATGRAFAFVRDDTCAAVNDVLSEMVVAASVVNSGASMTVVGTIDIDNRVGSVAEPAIAPDGSMVAWTTTMPIFNFDEGGVDQPPLDEPVVRSEIVAWGDALSTEPPCQGPGRYEPIDVAVGSHASLSATGRTIAYQSPEPARIFAVDTHTNDGIAVSTSGGNLLVPDFMTDVEVANISIATLRGYASAMANAPVHRLPVHRLPVHRLPVHRLLVEDSPVHRLPIYQLPVHRLPVHRLDIPGGWTQLLADTPFAVDPLQAVTLDAVLAWAAATLADPDATPAQNAAALLIQSLTLGDLDLDGSGLDALTLASYTLGSAPVADLPIPGTGTDTGTEANLRRWQDLLTAQGGLGIELEAEMVLADLDAAGLDIAASRVDEIVLSDLPDTVIDKTLLDAMWIDPALLPNTPLGAIDLGSFSAEGREALFGVAGAGVTGTLAAPSAPLLEDATFADLVKGLATDQSPPPAGITLGDVLFSLVDAESYPWEQISPSSIDPRLASGVSNNSDCSGSTRCAYTTPFRFAFDAGPGEASTYAAPTVSVTLPAGTRIASTYVDGSGPGVQWNSNSLWHEDNYAVNGDEVSVAMADTQPGTVFELQPWYSFSTRVGHIDSTGTMTTGELTDSLTLGNGNEVEFWDDPTRNRDEFGNWETEDRPLLREGHIYYEWISPAWLDTDDLTGLPIQASYAGPDEDFYLVKAPGPGKRLVVSTNAMDGQISLSLYGPQQTGSSSASLGVASAGSVPGTLVVEQSSAAGAPAESGADAGAGVDGQTLIDQAVQRGDGTTQVEAASTDALPDTELLVRVTSGNGEPSAELYSLRITYVDEVPETRCTPWSPAFPEATGQIGASDPITPETNTVYLLDSERYAQTFGVQALADVRASLSSMTGNGRVGDTTVQGAIISVDASQAVSDARDILDANPCSMQARRQVTSAVNEYVSSVLGDQRSAIESVVVVGGDDILPFAPVTQNTNQFTEVSHSPELRLDSPPGDPVDDPCPPVADGEIDPCETPLSAAASGGYILTDDPYGLATAYESLGGYLYVPSVALGRLVETSAQIQSTIAQFNVSGGILPGDTTATGGYGAWAELPDQVTAALDWRTSGDTLLGAGDPNGLWTKADALNALFPSAAPSPTVVSINTHADERRMLPGIDGAEDGSFQEADLLTTADVTDASALESSLVFLIGCHAGNNLPSAYYGPDARDWVDVFSNAAGYVGNTGYGLANNVTSALGERLLALYADWIGVEVEGHVLSTSQSLTYAKQSYLGGLGLYSGYDEKVLMGAVYYGLPMYTFDPIDPPKEAPVPEIPAGLTALQTSADGLSSASFGLTPSFSPKTFTNAAGQTVGYFTADDEQPAVVAGQPVLPKVVHRLRAESGKEPRGVMITGLTSEFDDTIAPVIANAGVGVPETTATRSDVAFPSTFATVTRQGTPADPVDLVVVTPGRAESWQNGAGRLEKFTDMALDVLYADLASTDRTAPFVSEIEATQTYFGFRADPKGGVVKRAVLLAQFEGDTTWTRMSFPTSSDGPETWFTSQGFDGTPYRWILQVADDSGNVTTESGRGHLERAGTTPPTIADNGGPETVVAGGRLNRAVAVGDVEVSDRVTARADLIVPKPPRDGGGEGSQDLAASPADAVTSSIVPVERGADGVTRALISQLLPTPGVFALILTVCNGESCVKSTIDITVVAANTPPSASVELSPDTPTVHPGSVLTADAEGTDPDGSPIPSLTYQWFRNGALIQGQAGTTLDLSAVGASSGDVIRVTVTPFDGIVIGHSASAEVTVGIAPDLPPAPQIVATATTPAGAYVEGSWTNAAVTVSFACTGYQLLSCTDPVTVSTETPVEGVIVEGTVRDGLGREAEAAVLVKVDLTAPTLAPTASPPTVPVGESVTVAANAADALSGLVSEACDVPSTSTAGTKVATCRATDAAGNTASAQVSFVVQSPGPALPVITVTAKSGPSKPYVEGTWSRLPVTLTYTCTSGARVTSCPKPVTISKDTGPNGTVIVGTMRDALGRTAQVSYLVKVDRTPPKLAPSASPKTVEVGAAVVLSPNATDGGSGVAQQSCDPPDTTTAGSKSAACRATDAAGNETTATVSYTVRAPAPPGPRMCFGAPDRAPLGVLNADGSSVFAKTSGVPVVFRACDAAGSPIGTAGFVTGTALVSTTDLPRSAKVNEAWYLPIDRFSYVSLTKTWIGTIPTATLQSQKKYTYRVSLADGTSFTVTFGVR